MARSIVAVVVHRGASFASTVAAIARAKWLDSIAQSEREENALRRRELSWRAASLRPDDVAWGLPRRPRQSTGKGKSG